MPPSPGPVPIAACFWAVPPSVFVRFDQPLVAGVGWDTGNWFVRWLNETRAVTQVSTVGDQVVLDLAAGVGGLGPNVVSFSPPPFDIEGLFGNVADPFADYPLVPCP